MLTWDFTFGDLFGYNRQPSSVRVAVRERPPLGLTAVVGTPTGKKYRWASDEPDIGNVPLQPNISSTLPGGHEAAGCRFARKPDVDYGDMVRLSTVTFYGADGEIAWQGRINDTPSASGDDLGISPVMRGWQAALEDDETVRLLVRHIDQSVWKAPALARETLLNAAYVVNPGASLSDSAVPKIRTSFNGPWAAAPGLPVSETWFDALGLNIGKVTALWDNNAEVDGSGADPNWLWRVMLASADDGVTGGTDDTGDLQAVGPALAEIEATAARQYALLQLAYTAVPGYGDQREYAVDWVPVVHGDHGLTEAPYGGYLGSDILRYAVPKLGPPLRVTDESVQEMAYAIQQAAWLEPGTLATIVTDVCRFELPHWAVWDDKVFWLYHRGTVGRTWTAPVGPAKLTSTGPQMSRLWAGVQVRFDDVDGSTKTVGPPNSGATVEDERLLDDDPDNPAVQSGSPRVKQLTLGVSQPQEAIAVGEVFLRDQKLLETAGQAELTGWVQDTHGVLYPHHAVRAGDRVIFPDASDPSPREIVRADHNTSDGTSAIDIDSPPEGLEQLLERLGAENERLGV